MKTRKAFQSPGLGLRMLGGPDASALTWFIKPLRVSKNVAKTWYWPFSSNLPQGASFSGFIGQAIWLLARLLGAALLFSIGVAFRNQVTR
jgi:hypothetical protein